MLISFFCFGGKEASRESQIKCAVNGSEKKQSNIILSKISLVFFIIIPIDTKTIINIKGEKMSGKSLWR